MFYIKTLNGSDFVITVPDSVKDRDYPTMEPKAFGYSPTQLWKFVQANEGPNLLIQNYDMETGGLVLDTSGTPGTEVIVYSRQDWNDNQKYFVRKY